MYNGIKTLNNWEKETADPFTDKTMLSKFTAEVDEVERTHPKWMTEKIKILNGIMLTTSLIILNT